MGWAQTLARPGGMIIGVFEVASNASLDRRPPMPRLEHSARHRELLGLQWCLLEAFRSGLVALGYAEGKNIRVLYRFAYGNADQLPGLTHELVSLGARVIVTRQTVRTA
jgi:hypothetical protein